MRKCVAIVGLVLALTACGGGGPSKSKSEAFCSDLASGLTPMQIFGADSSNPKKNADLAYGMAKLSCPDELNTNQALRAWLQNWGINPDS